MAFIKTKFREWLEDDSGATAIEYSLIAVGIAIFIAAIVYEVGDVLVDLMYNRLPAILN